MKSVSMQIKRNRDQKKHYNFPNNAGKVLREILKYSNRNLSFSSQEKPKIMWIYLKESSNCLEEMEVMIPVESCFH